MNNNDEDYRFMFCFIQIKYLTNRVDWRFPFTFLCVCCFFENFIISGTATVIISTLEKEFYLTSRDSGLFLSVYELAAFVASPIVGFLGTRYNKWKSIGVSLLLVAFGSYLIAVTVFLKPINQAFQNTNTSWDLCTNNNRSFAQECRQIRNTPAAENLEFMLYIGHGIIGLGSVALYTNGVAYIEDITHVTQSSYCQAIFYGIGSIGGGLAILLTGQFLNINSRFYLEQFESIQVNNPNWIGAWWLPYMSYASVLVVLGILSYGFPAKTRNKRKETTTSPLDEDTHGINGNSGLRLFISEFISKFKSILNNYKLIAIILSSATEGILFKGFLGFISKYFESQFQLTAANSTLITGSIALVSILIGTLIGAFLINRFNWRGLECSLFCFVVYFFTSLCFWILLVSCPNRTFESMGEDKANCNCENIFNPVCIRNEQTLSTYQSACHAGCTDYNETSLEYTDCLENKSVVSLWACDNTSVRCPVPLALNILAAFLIVFLTAVALIPHLKALLNCIQEKDQAFTLGINAAVNRLIGNFAGSIIVGQAIDLTCSYWLENCYGQRNCKMYDNSKMSVSLAAIGFTCRFLTSLFTLTACFFFYRENGERPNSKRIVAERVVSSTTHF
jgi:organic anion transporter 4A